jgi:hypothetical protein
MIDKIPFMLRLSKHEIPCFSNLPVSYFGTVSRTANLR